MKLRIIDWEKVEKKFKDELDEMHRRESEYFTRTSTQGVKLRGTISGWTWMYGIVEDALVTDQTFEVAGGPPPKLSVPEAWNASFSVKDGEVYAHGLWSASIPVSREKLVELLNNAGRKVRELMFEGEEGK